MCVNSVYFLVYIMVSRYIYSIEVPTMMTSVDDWSWAIIIAWITSTPVSLSPRWGRNAISTPV